MLKLLNNFAVVVAFMPMWLFCDLAEIRSNLHFRLYQEMTTQREFGTSDYWMAVGRVQLLSELLATLPKEET